VPARQTCEAEQRLERFLSWHHGGLRVQDLLTDEEPGYWIVLSGKPSPDGKRLRIWFAEPGARIRGRFASPYRVWRKMRERERARLADAQPDCANQRKFEPVTALAA
jgi:hypothetical protein